MKPVFTKEAFEQLSGEYYDTIRVALEKQETANYGALLYALIAMIASTTAVSGVEEKMVKQLFDETFTELLHRYKDAVTTTTGGMH